MTTAMLHPIADIVHSVSSNRINRQRVVMAITMCSHQRHSLVPMTIVTDNRTMEIVRLDDNRAINNRTSSPIRHPLNKRRQRRAMYNRQRHRLRLTTIGMDRATTTGIARLAGKNSRTSSQTSSRTSRRPPNKRRRRRAMCSRLLHRRTEITTGTGKVTMTIVRLGGSNDLINSRANKHLRLQAMCSRRRRQPEMQLHQQHRETEIQTTTTDSERRVITVATLSRPFKITTTTQTATADAETCQTARCKTRLLLRRRLLQ